MPGKNPRKGTVADRAWDIEEIRELIDMLTERDVAEFEMEKNGLRIRVKRGRILPEQAQVLNPLVSVAPLSVSPIPAVPSNPVVPVGHTVAPGSPEPSSSALEDESVMAESAEDLYVIKSPIVGTYYAAATPNAPPFVKAGDMVEVGQVLCIVEAMKLMNEIESEIAGEIVKVYVDNGQPVEYGQSLFAIKPSHRK